MKRILLIPILVSGFFACERAAPEPEGFAAIQKQYLEHLDSSVFHLEQMQETLRSGIQAGAGPSEVLVGAVRDAYRESRRHFKHAEPVLAWNESENYEYLNGPNIPKMMEEDQTNIKILNFSGFQALEETVFEEGFGLEEAHNHARQTANRLRFIRENTDLVSFAKEHHFLWLVRDAILRIAFTGITGFDSPALENSVADARLVYSSLERSMAAFRNRFRDAALYADWQLAISDARGALHGDFTTFDRFGFIQRHTHVQLRLWNRTVGDWGVTFPAQLALTDSFASPFSPEAFHVDFFADPQSAPYGPAKIALGKLLFHDTRLSSPDKQMSCASCHIEAKGFADNNRTSFGLARNTPTIAYAGLQKAFFLDGREGSLEGQIVSVVESELEFHTNLSDMEAAIQEDSAYVRQFQTIYGDTLNEMRIRDAIAGYVRSLSPFSSRFDRTMRGEENSLTDDERHGFNLFMGKGKCATCHFPPVFNGTIPPAFTDSELEHLGVPDQPDTAHARISPDLGRYHFFKVEERKHFFKTPTVRNAALTAPYMHNGVYDSLEQVVDFYNRGGGIGIGIEGPETEFQTLPPDELGLTEDEIAALVAFMESLTDALPTGGLAAGSLE